MSLSKPQYSAYPVGASANVHIFIDGLHCTFKTTIIEMLRRCGHKVVSGDFAAWTKMFPEFLQKHLNPLLSKLYDLNFQRDIYNGNDGRPTFYDRSIFAGPLYDAIRRIQTGGDLEKELCDFVKFVEGAIKCGIVESNWFFLITRVHPSCKELLLQRAQKRNNNIDDHSSQFLKLEEIFFDKLAETLGKYRCFVFTSFLDDESQDLMFDLALSMTSNFMFSYGARVNGGDNTVDLLAAQDLLVDGHTFVPTTSAFLFGRGVNAVIYGKSSKAGALVTHSGVVDPFFFDTLTVFQSPARGPFQIYRGDRVAQVVFSGREQMVLQERPALSNRIIAANSRGGFGSTNNSDPVGAMVSPQTPRASCLWREMTNSEA